jgi:putative hydrolase of the HAD superfamily
MKPDSEGIEGMVVQLPEIDKIEAILFDMNGTLRERIPDEIKQKQSVERLLAILGKPDAPIEYLEELTSRYRAYTRWADENETSLPETEIWTQWITPELPLNQIEMHATELMLVFRNRNGRSILKPGAAAVITEMSRRGYRLGVISNTTSSADLPGFIEESGLKQYFEVVILSSVLGARKPGARIFKEATRLMRLDPVCIAYLGNKIANDIVGAHKAGYGLALLLAPTNVSLVPEKDPLKKPDLIIHELSELLALFPPRLQK